MTVSDKVGNHNTNGGESENLALAICRFLRAKTGYGTTEGGENPWLLLDDAGTTVFKCLRTLETVGTDGFLAEAGSCRTGRKCFESPEKTV